ncbi:MAG: hypothetical protein J6S69_07000, partial [Proteobacteria bacterium]|nr:hypothetical protein [Pseudomonadota bacterium]
MKICFLISQNSALYSICKDALAQVTPYIELRMIGDDAAYQQAAAVHGIALVIVECTKYDRDNPAFRAALRKRLHGVQTDAAIPVIYADPKLQTSDEDLIDSDTLVISPTASLDKWIQIISRALGVTETRLYHGDIDDIFEDFSIYDAPQVPNILSTEDFLKSAKPLEPHQFDIAISEAWTISNPPESTRKKSSALVQDISFNDDKMIAPAYRKSLVSQSHLKPIQPQFARAEAEKPSKPSLLDRLLKRHKSDAVQPAQSLKRLNSTPPPKVPRLIQPSKPPVPRPAAQIQQPSNPMLSSERVLPPANATGFNIEIGSIAEASVSVQNDVQAPMLSSEHVMPPEKATGFDIEIGNIAEQNTEAVPEMLDPENFRPQDSAKFAIGGAFKREETASTPEMLDPEEFRPQDTAKFAIGGAF